MRAVSRAQRIAVVVTSILAGATRFLALAKFPWDWDEILFCLAVRDYNMQAHQPHPPGFPLYVGLAKIARLFTGDDFRALQAINILAALAVFPVLFWLARSLRLEFRTAYCAAVLFSFLPNVWFYGGTGFSDLPALVCYLAAAAAFLSVDAEDVKRYALASLLLAAALLIRPHSFLIAIYPWVAATVRLVRARRTRAVVMTGVALVLVVGIGYGIAATVTGWGDFLLTLQNHSRFVRQTDSIENPTRPPLVKIIRMELDPYEAGKVSLALNLLALVALVFGARRLAAEVLLTFLPFAVFMMFALSHVGFSRLSMSFSAGLAILAAEGIAVLARLARRGDLAVRIVITGALVARLVWWMLPAFEQPRTTLPPPNAAAIWLRAHTDAHSKIFAHDSMWPWARYYLGDRNWEHVGDAIGLTSENDVRDEWLLKAGPSISINSHNFRRPHNRTWNVVAQRYFEAYAQPVSDIVFFGSGWYQIEWDTNDTWRWMDRRSSTMLPPLGGACELRIRYSVPVDVAGHPIRVAFSINGVGVGNVTATAVDNEARFVVRARGNAPNILRIEVSDTIRAPGDVRNLGLRLWSWGWRRIGD
jgi:hypothetical protein